MKEKTRSFMYPEQKKEKEELEERVAILIHYFTQKNFGAFVQNDSAPEDKIRIADGLHLL